MVTMTNTEIDREWLVSELEKLIDEERVLLSGGKIRAGAPPSPELEVLYHEIAAADERHVTALETIATRYGHTPTRTQVPGVTATLGRLTGQVAEMGSSPWDLVARDLAAKASSLPRQAVWVPVFEAIGDDESAAELRTLIAEDCAHQDALLTGLSRLVAARVMGQ